MRVKNFQSIEDAEINIEGFVVICGPNNSGKTALMRAIRGLFTNAAPGSYLRQGANFLSVEINFDDGTSVLWEKGWEKPYKKGAAINRYTLNGYLLTSVGRGVPPEIEALGVQSIFAGSTPIWPQVADQFDGTLFLVNKTGAVVAEALSDVERVGRLTDSLRLADKDKRSAVSELRVRRDDLKKMQEDVRVYSGLDAVGTLIAGIAPLKEAVLNLKVRTDEAQELKVRLDAKKSDWDTIKSYECFVPKELEGIRDFPSRLNAVRSLSTRLLSAREASQTLAGFQSPKMGDYLARELRGSLKEAQAYSQRLCRLSSEKKVLEGFYVPTFTENPKLQRIPRVLSVVADFLRRMTSLRKSFDETSQAQEQILQEVTENEALVKHLLGARGYCPTCKTVHRGGVS